MVALKTKQNNLFFEINFFYKKLTKKQYSQFAYHPLETTPTIQTHAQWGDTRGMIKLELLKGDNLFKLKESKKDTKQNI